MSSAYMNEDDQRYRDPWPIRVLLQTGLVKNNREAERALVVAIAVILIITAWTFFHSRKAGPDPSGEPNPAAAYFKG